jgi:hypothetical protein
MARNLSLVGLLVVVTAASLATRVTPAVAENAAHVDVCCAWNQKLADGILTYEISGATDDTLATITDAIEDWDDALAGLSLEPVSGGVKPDIAVTFRRTGGTVQGHALRQYNSRGFITSVSVYVSGMSFGVDYGGVHQITLHEVGHALGAGHADGDGVLMSATVDGGVDYISSCDLKAVIAANAWFFNSGWQPHQPSTDSISC